MSYTLQHIAKILKSKSEISSEQLINYLLIDSRKLVHAPTTLFFALKGPRNNGHAFVKELYDKGVRAFVVSESGFQELAPEASFIEVSDTLSALQLLAAHHRKQFNIPVIGITGSNGKTIVKEWLYQLLQDSFSIVRSPKSYNSQIGVPLSVWPMMEHHQLALFEAGISQSGEMDKLQKIIQPTIGVFTNIGEAHSEGFLNIRQKVNEKLRLFTHVKTLIYCKDDPQVHTAVAGLWQQLHRDDSNDFTLFNWSTVSDATLQILTIFKDNGKSLISANYKGQTIQIEIPFTDDASVENAIHCWCVMLHLDVKPKEISKRMKQLEAIAMRLELKQGVNHCSVINDSYNTDINSLKIALDFLVQQQQQPKRTVILSDILQSGKPERELYQEVSDALKQREVHRFIGIGEKLYAYQNLFQQLPNLETKFYKSTESFLSDFPQLTFREEVILLKGARVFEFELINQRLEEQRHQTVMEINLNALVHNLKWYQEQLKPGTRIMAMVKAFAYGSGSYEIARLLQYHKVDYLAVAYTDEGVALRKRGIQLPIMVMNPDASSFDQLVQFHLEPDVYSVSLLNELVDYLKKQGIEHFPVHIELETGMNRLGFNEKELSVLETVLDTTVLKVQAFFSHLVASESPAFDGFTRQQGALFVKMCDRLSAKLSYPVLRHLSNTSGIARFPDLQFDMVRLGIGLYGVESGNTHIREASTLKTSIAQIKQLEPGETVGYGRKGILQNEEIEREGKRRNELEQGGEKPCSFEEQQKALGEISRAGTIATIRIGYADGYSRALSNGKGKVMIKGQLAPVVGWICMDMTMVDISHIPGVKEGDEVIVFGGPLSVKEVAKWADTIPYELISGVSQRVRRLYYEE
ncbi:MULTISPECIES: bifunctional UDP-N-acetylmuramoyl-tripeptide:D-alanyl-D-alanine ligase/alanine racemase [unclassified Paraflavitalea]|uniref:bifunctional UDP-N-acetylmuramoyl-tripeptide:D-alanyl-D-alanine ligase/alanine racemase n=1 Tax=unclassified Paraflavitalea TaxID=2798305 RepID=UPI003D343E00